MPVLHEFEYLRTIARKYGEFYFAAQFEEFDANATDEQLNELKIAYETMDAQGECARVSHWVNLCLFDGASVGPDEVMFAQQVGQLFVLFRHLGERGIFPFASGTVAFVNEQKEPNWENLPSELSYLIDPAGLYGVYYCESDIVDFLRDADKDDIQTLATTAERIRVNKHMPIINKWLDAFPMNKFQEARLVYFLLGVFDHAGLKFE